MNIALEVTELIAPNDKVHERRRKLESQESLLESLLSEGLEQILEGCGAIASISIDLDKDNQINKATREIGRSILEKIRNHLNRQSIFKGLQKHKIKMVEIDAEIDLVTNDKWSQITCNVGYKGAQLHDVTTQEISEIIERKDKKIQPSDQFNESWL